MQRREEAKASLVASVGLVDASERGGKGYVSPSQSIEYFGII